MPFIVVSGKIEQLDNGQSERNYSYISQAFTELADALADWEKNQGYAFNEIEYNAPDGKRYTVSLYPIEEE